MFVKQNNCYVCYCGNNKFTIELKKEIFTNIRQTTKFEIYYKTTILWDEYGFLHILIGRSQGFTFAVSNDYTLENIVELFNQQITEQIQSLYEPGGEKYKESEKWINAN
jgi:hypothetical protein